MIWISTDDEDYFQTGDITAVLRLAERVGIAAWTLNSMDPTSAFTHPGMHCYIDGILDFYCATKVIATKLCNKSHVSSGLCSAEM